MSIVSVRDVDVSSGGLWYRYGGSLYNSCLGSGGLLYSAVATRRQPKNLGVRVERFLIENLDLVESRFTSSRVEEEEHAQNRPCGKAVESKRHTVAECELYKEERDVLEGEMRDVNK
ncbi:unnamed protein product, partial [Sphacelaria rigidula]